MWLLLILFSLFFIYLNFLGFLHRKNYDAPIRNAFIYTSITAAIIIFTSVELLSVCNAITQTAMICVWSITLIISVLVWIKNEKKIPSQLSLKHASGFEKFLLASILIILCTTLLSAIVSYPNNWDSMTYHLSRVMFWIQHNNVNHYPTQVDRQISQPPLAEYGILNIRLLCNNDRMANLVQWLCMCGSVICSSLIVKLISTKRTAQLLAAFFTASIPMGILQSNSTQNDYVVSFFILNSIYFLFRFIKCNCGYTDVVLFFICVALAAETKGTAYIFLPPVVCIFFWKAFQERRTQILKYAATACVCGLFFCSPFYIRNYITYHQPLGPSYNLENTSFGVGPSLSNISKNIAIQLKTPIPALNTGIQNITAAFNKAIGIDIYSKNYNWEGSPAFYVGHFSTQEDSAANTLHLILFLCCIVLFFSQKQLRKNKLLQIIFITTIIMFILFCTILKWQVWHCRLHLPLFAIMCGFMAVCIHSLSNKIALVCISLILLGNAFIFLFFNQSRSILWKENIFNTPRMDQYFATNKDIEKTFFDISGLMWQHNVRSVGWVTSGDTWQYPMWQIMAPMPGFKMENILVENDSHKYELTKPYSNFTPDAIIVTRLDVAQEKTITYHNNAYYLTYDRKGWYMYEKTNSASK